MEAYTARLKDRTRFPPGSFQLLIPEIGMAAPVKGSFNEIVTAFDKIVRANPALAEKHEWPTNREAQEAWLDAREAQRLIAHGWLKWVDLEGDPPQPAGGARRINPGANVAAAVSGLAIYREIFSGNSVPVAHDEAERRAGICVGCPQNNTKLTFKQRFVAATAKGLTELVSVMRDYNLTTSRDKELGTCEACECPLFGKVHVAMPTILKHMKPEQHAKLDARCWILTP